MDRDHTKSINKAITAQIRLVATTPRNDPIFSSRITDLGDSLWLRFEAAGDIAQFRRSLSSLKKAGVDIGLAERVTNHAISLAQDYNRTGDIASLNVAVALLEEAIDMTPIGHGQRASRLNSLGIVLKRRFARLDALEDIERAVTSGERACDLTARNDPNLRFWLNNLANSLSIRFQHTGDIGDIKRSVKCLEEAIRDTPATDHNLSGMLNNLGGSLKVYFEHTGDRMFIEDSITSLRRSILLTPENHPEQSSRLNTLGEALAQKFERLGGLDIIHEAITTLKLSIDRTPSGHPALAHSLNSVGKALLLRYDRTSDVSDLQEAILSQRRAVRSFPKDHPLLPALHNSLATSLATRFHRLGDLGDLEESITLFKTAVQLTPSGRPDLAIWYSNLGSSLQTRYLYTEVEEDIKEAISSYKRAVEMTPSESPQLHSRFSNLGMALAGRFSQSGGVSDIEESITWLRKAVDIIPFDHPDHPLTLHHLASSLMLRFKVSGQTSDLESAIAMFGLALDVISPESPNACTIAVAFGDALAERFSINAKVEDLMAAKEKFRDAAMSTTNSPRHRIRAAQRLSEVSEMLDFDDEALEAQGLAVELVSLVAELGRTKQTQHSDHTLRNDVSMGAAATALKYGATDKALEWLEQGRSLLWREVHNLHTPIDDLRISSPELSGRFLALSLTLEELDGAHDSTFIHTDIQLDTHLTRQTSTEERSVQYIKRSKERDALLTEIRAKPGFESFLRPASISSLLERLPNDGPTVILNVHERRCDAIILTPGFPEPQSIPLPLFNVLQGEMLYRKLRESLLVVVPRTRGDHGTSTEDGLRAIRRTKSKKELGIMGATLGELWLCVVKPVIDHLGLAPSDMASEKKRIWWCPTGPLAFLPIHAAGLYGEQRQRLGHTLLDYAISSYIPTLAALAERSQSIHAHSVPESEKDSDLASNLLLISQPNTPGLAPLPGTVFEIEAIQRLIEELGSSVDEADDRRINVLHLDGPAATVATTAAQMPQFNIVHLACHGEKDPENPLQSRFHLYDGQLTLSSIIQGTHISKRRDADANSDIEAVSRGTSPSLAFLSACQTSAGSERHSEEAVHLAAGMLAAGYRSVVGTMWSIPDYHAPSIAEEFYRHLLGLGSDGEADGNKLDASQAAYALHCATEKLRRQLGNSEEAFLAWVPYVHFGV